MRSSRRFGDVDHDRLGSLVEESLDELDERVWIFEACSRVEAGNLEELPVALHAPVYPPGPHLLAFAPPTNFHSRHAGLFFPIVVSSGYSHALEVATPWSLCRAAEMPDFPCYIE